MAHLHLISNKNGQVIDQKIYCSDICNLIDNGQNYNGWCGCNEIDYTQKCDNKNCGNIVNGIEKTMDLTT
jgi:hypothetical protein